MECLGIQEDTILTPAHAQQLAMEGYVKPLREKYPNKKITLVPRHDGSLYQRAMASLLRQEQDVTAIRAEWFAPQPWLIICGGGHVAKEVAAMAAHLDFHTRIFDNREDLMTPERFPTTPEPRQAWIFPLRHVLLVEVGALLGELCQARVPRGGGPQGFRSTGPSVGKGGFKVSLPRHVE